MRPEDHQFVVHLVHACEKGQERKGVEMMGISLQMMMDRCAILTVEMDPISKTSTRRPFLVAVLLVLLVTRISYPDLVVP